MFAERCFIFGTSSHEIVKSGKIGGTVASSPTSLSRAPKNAFGVSVCSVDGCSFGVGQCETSVPVQVLQVCSVLSPLNSLAMQGAGAFISGCVASSQESLNSVMSLVANQMCVNDEFQVSRDGKPLHLVSEAGLIATSSCILANVSYYIVSGFIILPSLCLCHSVNGRSDVSAVVYVCQ